MRSIVLFTVGALALAGCAVEAAPEASDTSASEALTYTLSTPLVGSYARTDGGMQLADLTLNADGTYAADNVVYCFRAPCPPVHVTGKWSSTGSGSVGTLKLTPKGQASQTFAVTIEGALGSLSMIDSAGNAFEEVRSPKTCGGIANLQCGADFTCVYPAVITHPDTAGECIPNGGEGTSCGGFTGQSCFQGLNCKPTSSHSTAGTCIVPKSAADCTSTQKWCSILTTGGDKGYCTPRTWMCPL